MAVLKVSELDEDREYDLLMSTLLDDPQFEVRLAAAKCLSKRHEEAFQMLLAVATYSNSRPWVQCDAIQALGRTGNSLAVPPLVAMLQESEPRAQEAARCALIDLGKLAVSHLSALLRNPQLLVTARREACIGLGHIGDPDALPALLDCQQEPDAQLCQWIAWALGKLPVDERSVQALVKLRSHNDVKVSDAALESLIKLTASSSLLRESLSSKSEHRRRTAIGFAIELGLVSNCAPILTAIMQSDEDAYCRLDAAIALTKIDDLEILKAVNHFRAKFLPKLFSSKARRSALRELDSAIRKSQCRSRTAQDGSERN